MTSTMTERAAAWPQAGRPAAKNTAGSDACRYPSWRRFLTLGLESSCRRGFWRPLRLAIALVGLPALSAHAAPIETDLGDGLRFHRVHELPGDLPAPPEQPTALILDLRYVAGNDDAAMALHAWLKFRAAPATPVLVLVNSETSSTLLRVLTANETLAGLLTLGGVRTDFSPDIIIQTGPAAERRAYDALEQGEPMATLVTENAGKPRTDEASIMRERANLPKDRAGAEDDDFELSDAEKPLAPPPPPPPVDEALRRAMHVHRALRALRRI